MHKFMLFILALVAGLLVSTTLNAQVGLRLNFNIDRQPVWGPTGYDHVEYYYFPAIETYYNVAQHRFFYNERGRWVGRSQLPRRYRDFDFYRSYKVVVNERRPYLNHRMYRDKYSSYGDRHDQESIRDSRDERYYVNRDHPEHDKWVRRHRHDNGNDRGRGDGDIDNREGNDRNGQRDDQQRGGSVGMNIGDQPMWGPTGYDRADYYYLPDINSYYSISERQYIYRDGSQWRHSTSLPSSYSNYDPYTSYKVVLNENNPFENNDSHRAKYGSFRGNRDQQVIRDSHDHKYFANRDHPEHATWVREQRR